MFSVPYLDMVRMPTGRGKKSSSEALMEADKLIFVSRINSRQSRRGGGAGVLVQLNSISFIELTPCHHVLVTLNRGILLGMKLRIIRITKGESILYKCCMKSRRVCRKQMSRARGLHVLPLRICQSGSASNFFLASSHLQFYTLTV